MVVFVVFVDPRKLPLRVGQNHVINMLDFDDIEFLWWMVVGVV